MYVYICMCVKYACGLPNLYICSDLKDTLSDKIAESQNLMRMYAAEHYTKSKQFSAEEADELSRSCVSQRDIQVSSC